MIKAYVSKDEVLDLLGDICFSIDCVYRRGGMTGNDASSLCKEADLPKNISTISIEVPEEKSVVNADTAPREMTARELLLTEERMLQEDADAYNKYVSLSWGDRKLDEAAAFAEDWAKKHPKEK